MTGADRVHLMGEFRGVFLRMGTSMRFSVEDRSRRELPSGDFALQQGVTLIEILVVLGIIAVIAGFGVFGNRGMLIDQQERAAIRSIQQSIWQGATAASARGRNTELLHVGSRVEIREVGSGVLVRSEDLPQGISTSLPNLVFTPPGKISDSSFALVADGIEVNSSRGTQTLRVSVIGEVLLETEQP